MVRANRRNSREKPAEPFLYNDQQENSIFLFVPIRFFDFNDPAYIFISRFLRSTLSLTRPRTSVSLRGKIVRYRDCMRGKGI